MPRRKQGFSRLEYGLRATGFNPPAGSILERYKQFKSGDRKKTIRKQRAAEANQRVSAAIAPFNASTNASTLAAEDLAIVTFSLQSQNGKTATGLSNTLLGQFGIEGAESLQNFFPALIKVSVPSSSNSSNETSGITGRTYKYREATHYSLPFGRIQSDLTEGEEDRRMTLTAEIRQRQGSAKGWAVSYEPEEFGTTLSAIAAAQGLTNLS